MSNALEQLPKLMDANFAAGSVVSAEQDIETVYLAAGSENCYIAGTGRVEVFKGVTVKAGLAGGSVFSNVAESYASLGRATDASGYGNVFNVFSALFFIGAGLLRLTGLSLLVNASSTLSLLIKRNGSYTDAASGLFQAGLAQSSAPIIRAITPPPGFTGKVNGVVSVVVWRIRSSTGARSIQSPVSNIVGAINQALVVRFPLADANGQDYWGIGVTKQTEGETGSHFELLEIPESAVAAGVTDGEARTVVIEYRDGDLVGKILAPTRDFPPPAALFGGTLEDVAFVDGAVADAVQSVSNTVKGTAIAPSEPGRPESYSPDNYIFTNDTPTCLLRADGYYARFCANAMYIIRYTGGDKPLSVEPAWQNLGIGFQTNACVGEGNRIYVFSGIPYRMGADGLPDSRFADKIINDFDSWTDASKIVLGTHNVKFLAVCYCYGQTVRAFFPSTETWSAPFNLAGKITGIIKSCVTQNNQLILSTSDGTNDYLYDFNVGTGTVAKIQTGWRESAGSLDTVNTVIAHVRADNTANNITIEVLADYDQTAVSAQILAIGRTGYQRVLVQPNVQDCQSHAVRLTITSATANGSCGVERIKTYGESNGILY